MPFVKKNYEDVEDLDEDVYCSIAGTKDIYIYAFSRRFYPKRLTVHSGYTLFISMCVPWELNPQPSTLLTQCSTTEPQEHLYLGFNGVGMNPEHPKF